jgi:histidinol-phosphatase (PHP family)
VALSSDAHSPNDLAYRYEEALEFLNEVGVDRLAVFEGRERRLEPVG